MKKCFKCGQEKPIEEYYKHPQMRDGRLGKCKDCTKKENRGNRQSKIEYYKKYDRWRASLPHRVKARKDYLETEKGRLILTKSQKNWLKNSLHKRSASHCIGNAVRDKKIIKPAYCSLCKMEKPRIEGHHWDYSKPLQVIWLCTQCHQFIHSLIRHKAI